MSPTSSPSGKNQKSTAQQSDIVIGPDGSVHISFLWDDLRDLAGIPSSTFNTQKWNAPENFTFDTSEYFSCQLCPKKCGFNRVEARHPRCGDAKLRVSNVGLTFGDEPSIRGTQGSGAIMFPGCPLKCPSCHNPEKVADGEETTAGQFFEHCRSLLEQGAHNIQILSPTVHFPALRQLLQALKSSQFPLPIVLKSSGYENVEEIQKLSGLVDIYLPDLKFGNISSWAVRAGVRNYFNKAQEAIAEMIRQVGEPHYENGILKRGVLVRHVEAPLPEAEKREIHAYLEALPAEISLVPHFVNLE